MDDSEPKKMSALKKTLWGIGGTVAGAGIIGFCTLVFTMNNRLNQLESLGESKLQERVNDAESRIAAHEANIVSATRSNEAQWRIINEIDQRKNQHEIDLQVAKTIQEKLVLPYIALHEQAEERRNPPIGPFLLPELPDKPKSSKPKIDDIKKSLDRLKAPANARPYEKFKDEQIQQHQQQQQLK